MDEISVLIPAAGASSRLGRPKQLVKTGGKTLVTIAIETCIKAGFSNVNVVLGYEHEKIKKEVSRHPVTIILNNNWKQGIGKSLAVGVQAIIDNSGPKTDGILIYLADQPRITSQHLKALYQAFSKGKEIVASGYAGTFGPPLIFGKHYFPIFQDLEGDEGAKKIFKDHLDKIYLESFEPARIDIDRVEDMENLT